MSSSVTSSSARRIGGLMPAPSYSPRTRLLELDLGARAALAVLDADVRGHRPTLRHMVVRPFTNPLTIGTLVGLLEAFPAEVRQIAPGQFVALPGPRFEPETAVTRGVLAAKLNGFAVAFRTGL